MWIQWKHIPKPEARAILLSLTVGFTLMCVKFLAYLLTGSAAIFSDATESIVNVVASAFAFYALGLAHAPADESHPYGHGKVEFFSAGLEGSMIFFAAVVIAFRTADMLLRGAIHIEELNAGLLLMALAMVVNGVLGMYLIRSGRRQNSMALEADGRHLLSDAITSIVALGALIGVKLTGWVYLDPIGALILAGYLGWMGLRLLQPATAGLMDKQDLADEQLLRRILDAHVASDGKQPRICSYHKLRHRHSGRYHWVDFHIMVPAGLNIEQGHNIASAIEYEIELALRTGNATAHVEPCTDEHCAVCRDHAT